MVLDLHHSLDKGLVIAFDKGYLDVPYCLHQNNKNKSRSIIDAKGYLQWADSGSMPLKSETLNCLSKQKIPVRSNDFMSMLHYVHNKYDSLEASQF
jgi:methylaspartate mutase epsilon subunit